jgi:hypothetical protein
MKDETTIKNLTNELADKDEQVAATQRKLLLMRTNRYGNSLKRWLCMMRSGSSSCFGCAIDDVLSATVWCC